MKRVGAKPGCARQGGVSAIVSILLRWGLVASLYVSMTGCAIIATAGLHLAAQGVIAVALSPFALQAQAEKERCAELASKGIEVTEPLETAIAASEGEVRTFDPILWRSEFEGEGYPSSERREPIGTEGRIAITERSVLLLPAPGTRGVRIPYEVVASINLSPAHPHSMTVKSCNGRSDIFEFWHWQRTKVDREAATQAAAHLRARIAAFQPTTRQQVEPTR